MPQDFSQNDDPKSPEQTLEETTGNTNMEDNDSTDSDSLPLISVRSALPVLENDDTDSENDVPLISLKSKMKPQKTDSCDILVPKVDIFALVKVPLAFCSKYKYYIGLIVEEIKEENEPSSYLVRFLRKK